MITYSVDLSTMSSNGIFFSTLPNDKWEFINDIMEQLAIDIESGIYKRITVIYNARDYLSYTKAAIAYHSNLPALQEQYPELFI